MFNPIFKNNVQRQKHLGRRVSAEPGLELSYRKPKCVDQSYEDGHKNSNDNSNHRDEIALCQEISKMDIYCHTSPEQCTTKKQSYRLWWGAADQRAMAHGTHIHIII